MSKSVNQLVLPALALCAFAVVGCGNTESTTATDAGSAGEATLTSNTICPIMGNEVTDDSSVDWNGKIVKFCCPPCVDEWNALTDAEKEEKFTATFTSAPAESHDHSHGEEGHDHHGDEAHGETDEGAAHAEEDQGETSAEAGAAEEAASEEGATE